MLTIKKFNLVENAWNDGELANLAGDAEVKLQTGTSEAGVSEFYAAHPVKGHFHMSNCGNGINASVTAACTGVTKITLSKPENLSVVLTAHVTREVLIEKGKTTVDTCMKGLVAAKENGANFGTAVGTGATAGVITLGSAATETRVATLDLEVTVATATATSDAAHKITITPDNAACFLYFNILAPAVECVGKVPARHFEVRGAKSWNNMNEKRPVDLLFPVAAQEDGYAEVISA